MLSPKTFSAKSTPQSPKSRHLLPRSKIKEKTDERFKALTKELDQFCVLLIGMVTARQWQLDQQVEDVLRYIVKTKKHSADASKRYFLFNQILQFHDSFLV